MAVVNPTDYNWGSFNSNGVQKGVLKTDSSKTLYRFISSSAGVYMYAYDSDTIDQLIAAAGGGDVTADGDNVFTGNNTFTEVINADISGNASTASFASTAGTADHAGTSDQANQVDTINGKIEEGTNVTIIGTGTDEDPYEISASGAVDSVNGQTGVVVLGAEDVLTAENLGEFMDNGLATKLTPVGADALLARDSITNEAVEILLSDIQPEVQALTPNNTPIIAGDDFQDVVEKTQGQINAINIKSVIGLDFFGKSIYFYGDSYTAGSGATNNGRRYSTLVSKGVGGIEQNFGIAGRTLEKRSPIDYMGAQNMVDGVSTIPTKTTAMSMAIVALGLNDMGQTAPAYNTINYITDYKTVIDNFISKGWLPSQLLIIAPYYIGTAGYTAYASITGNAAPTAARHLDFIAATKSVADFYGAHYIDMYQEQLKNNTTLLVADNIHPNDAGHAFIGNTILRYLDGGLSYGSPIPQSTSTPLSLNLGGTFSSAAGSQANAKLKIFDDGTSSNVFGMSVSSGSFEQLAPSSANFDFFSGNTKMARISNAGAFLVNIINALTGTDITSSSSFKTTNANPILQSTSNSASGRGLLLTQNNAGSTAAWMITGTTYSPELPSNTAIMGGSTAMEIISNYTQGNGGTGNIILRQGGTASTNVITITPSGVGVGTVSPNASAALHIPSTTKGLLKPVMTTVQFAAISSKAEGLEAYDSTTKRPTVFNGTVVKQVAYVDDMKYGAASVVMNGTDTVFNIPHGLGANPTSIAITFEDAGNLNLVQSVRTKDATNIILTCMSPPAAGTAIVYWQVFR